MSFNYQINTNPPSPRQYFADDIEYFPPDSVQSGLTSNVESAAQQLATQQGIHVANFFLGRCFDIGDGVPQNAAKAAEYYYVAAEQGMAEAQHDLACCFLNGEGVGADLKVAIQYFLATANQDYVPAIFHLGNIMETKDPKRAAMLYQKAAQKGHSQAYFRLGCMCDNGKGVKQNFEMAARYYYQAAELGLAEAQFNLACSYDMGQGVQQNFADAMQWYTLAADQGHAMAQYNLAQCYHYGKGVQINEAGANHYYHLAAQQGINVPTVTPPSPFSNVDMRQQQRPRSVSFQPTQTNWNPTAQQQRNRSVTFQQGGGGAIHNPFGTGRSQNRNAVLQQFPVGQKNYTQTPAAPRNSTKNKGLNGGQHQRQQHSNGWENTKY